MGTKAVIDDAGTATHDRVAPPLETQGSRPYRIFVLHPSHFLTDHKPHGDGLLAFQFLTRLAKRGHEVHVAVSMRSIESELPPNLHLYDINTRWAPSIRGGSLINRMEFSYRAGALFRRLHRTVRFDVVHQFNPVLYGLCFLSGLGKTPPLVMGPIPPTWPRGMVHADSLKRRVIDALKAPLLQFQYRWAAAILPASPALLPGLDKVSARKAQLLPYGIDTDFFTPQGTEDFPSEPTVLFMANLWFGKGIFSLLDAFEHVHKVMPEARLIIAGKGTDQDEVHRRSRAHPAATRISMLGNIERARVPSVLRNCTVFCLPSYGEPFGMTALEAMSCGRATVTTNTGGLAHLGPPDGTFQVSPGRPVELAQALLRVLRDRRLAMQMGRRNREHVMRHYAWDVILSRLEAIYSRICKSMTTA